MRSVAISILATPMLIGCSSARYGDLPPPPPESEIILFYSGARENAPRCDIDDRGFLWDGWGQWASELGPDGCEPCECEPAECVRPSKVYVSALTCPDVRPIVTLNGGTFWDGACQAGAFSVSSPEYASVTFEAPTVAGCRPVSSEPEPLREGMTFVKTCKRRDYIIPTAFRQCYLPQPNGDCWRGFDGWVKFRRYKDTRKCAPCSCGAPRGAKCTVQTTLYSGENCSGEIGSVAISNEDGPICTTEIQGEVAAMRSPWVQNEPGSCTPSGGSEIVSGELELVETTELCCNF